MVANSTLVHCLLSNPGSRLNLEQELIAGVLEAIWSWRVMTVTAARVVSISEYYE